MDNNLNPLALALLSAKRVLNLNETLLPNHPKPTALQVEAIYHTSLSKVRFMVQNVWSIHSSKHHLLRTYYILRWQASYFRDNLSEGMIERKGVNYSVIYYNTTPYDIRKHDGELLISFRTVQKEFDILPTALITLV